jgi:hypothetical protein
MTLFAVEGVGGSGKTFRLIESLGEALARRSACSRANFHARRAPAPE